MLGVSAGSSGGGGGRVFNSCGRCVNQTVNIPAFIYFASATQPRQHCDEEENQQQLLSVPHQKHMLALIKRFASQDCSSFCGSTGSHWVPLGSTGSHWVPCSHMCKSQSCGSIGGTAVKLWRAAVMLQQRLCTGHPAATHCCLAHTGTSFYTSVHTLFC